MLCDGTDYPAGRDGKFRCPWKCHNPQFPAPSWKTEKGYAKHLAECSCNPKIGEDYVAAIAAAPEEFAECPDCGAIIMKMTSIWQMPERFVCFDCRGPYLEAGIGFQDCAGLILPGMTLEG